MRSRSPILGHLKRRLRVKEKMRKIKTRSMAFSCPRSSWRRDYLDCIKIIADQAPLGLRLTHNELPSIGQLEGRGLT
ncbi:unnamed protein product [Spirodela intermedia]|uniref:Uncharacterized protein n=1 Tax=Spirodela intermedia TaxID=51605 RepID=A0A7I8KAP8_SPIIN|nr:unnamed protein product [Spirodela intermedia]